MASLPLALSAPSQPQPEPWMAAVEALNFFLNSSKLPKSRSMALPRALSGLSLEASEPVGAKFFQL